MSLLEKFIPDLYVTSIHQISAKELKDKGIKGVLTDLDNTLVRWDQPDTTDEVIKWFNQLAEEGIQVIIISNNNELRVRQFAKPLNTVYIHKARKPMKRGFMEGLAKLELPAENVAVIGDQVLTDVFGGNRLGLYTILVDPIGEKEFITTKINRKIERRIVRHLFKKGLISWTR